MFDPETDFGSTRLVRPGQPAAAAELTPFKPNATVPVGGILVDANAETSDAESVVLAGRAITSFGQQPIWLNAGEEVASGNYGLCFRPSGKPVQVAFYATDGTPAAGDTWGPVPGQFTVRKGFPGFKCEAAGDTATGLVWAVMDLSEWIYALKLTADLAAASSAAVDVYYWTGSAYADSTLNGTVYAPHTLATTIPSGKKVNGRWTSAARRLEVFGPAEQTEVTVMTNFQVDTGSLKLQKKSRTAYVDTPGTESGWTDIHTGTACT